MGACAVWIPTLFIVIQVWRGWTNDNRICIFGWTITLNPSIFPTLFLWISFNLIIFLFVLPKFSPKCLNVLLKVSFVWKDSVSLRKTIKSQIAHCDIPSLTFYTYPFTSRHVDRKETSWQVEKWHIRARRGNKLERQAIPGTSGNIMYKTLNRFKKYVDIGCFSFHFFEFFG